MEVQIPDVRGRFVVVVHTQVPPVSDHLMELFVLLDAITNSNARDVLLVFPYMPYSRSDRKNKPRISVMGRTLPRMFNRVFGIKRVLLLDPHDSHTKHYYEPDADEITAIYMMIDHINRVIIGDKNRDDFVVVFADAGAASRYKKVAHILELPYAQIDKDRPKGDKGLQFNRVIGKVKGKVCLLIDDEHATGGTALGDAKILTEAEAAKIINLVIHPVLEKDDVSHAGLIKTMQASPIDHFVVTDSIPIFHKLPRKSKFTVLPSAPLLGEAINRIVQDDSLTALHQVEGVRYYLR